MLREVIASAARYTTRNEVADAAPPALDDVAVAVAEKMRRRWPAFERQQRERLMPSLREAGKIARCCLRCAACRMMLGHVTMRLPIGARYVARG